MAEAFVNHFARGRAAAESAGIEPGRLNPHVVTVMRELGIDISGNSTKSVQHMLGKPFDVVVTVCDEASAERCPVFPGNVKRLHWGFPDPSAVTGSDEEKLLRAREIRDMIRARIEQWLQELNR
jgi:arsenate reductase (thioredoxin)